MITFSTSTRTISISRRSLFIAGRSFQFDAAFTRPVRHEGEPWGWRAVDREMKTARGCMGRLEWCAAWGLRQRAFVIPISN